MTITTRQALAHAQAIAIAKLATALSSTDDPGEVRRLAEVLLKLDPDKLVAPDQPMSAEAPPPAPAPARAAPPKPATSPASGDDQPLTTDEINRLHRLLPHVKRERFIRKHTPSYWRSILARHPPPAHAPAAPAAQAA